MVNVNLKCVTEFLSLALYVFPNFFGKVLNKEIQDVLGSITNMLVLRISIQKSS